VNIYLDPEWRQEQRARADCTTSICTMRTLGQIFFVWPDRGLGGGHVARMVAMRKYTVLEFLKEEKKWVIPTPFPPLLEQPRRFYDYFRMLPETFWYIMNDIRDDIQKQSNFRKCISPEERLAVTLR